MTEQKFWQRVCKSDGCWTWTGPRTSNGYGFARLGQDQRAHRVAYKLLVGGIPEGLQLDHLCRNRLCVNPAHLEPVTPAENLRRGRVDRGEQATNLGWDCCTRGHAFDAQNTYVEPNGERHCKKCRRERERLRAPQHRAQKAAYLRAWRARQQVAS